MNFSRRRWCVVSSCPNTSNKTPEKLFIQVPENIEMRNIWLELAKRDPKSLSTKSRLYLCEDHFNLEQDMKNYMEYKIMGSVKHVKMKLNTTPSRFYHTEEKCQFSPSNSHSPLTNTQRLNFVQGTENSKPSKDYIEPTATSSKSDVPVLESVPISHEPLDVCAVFIKEEPPEEPENAEIHVKFERDCFDENEDGLYDADVPVLESVPSHDPLDVCAVFIKEEPPEEPENAEIHVKVERDCFDENEDGLYDADIPNGEDSGTFTCEICTKQFSQKRYMTAHRQRHPEYKQLAVKLNEEKLRLEQAKKQQHFTCLYCKKEFCSRSTVNRHMKIHTDTKPVSKDFICDLCNKSFTYKRDLRVHLRVHTGEKPFKCENCSKQFSQLASLQYHVQVHSDHKPYPCDICEKAFLRRISLERHKRIHAGVRPFKCQLCEKAFTRNRHLVAHIRIHAKHKRERDSPHLMSRNRR